MGRNKRLGGALGEQVYWEVAKETGDLNQGIGNGSLTLSVEVILTYIHYKSNSPVNWEAS